MKIFKLNSKKQTKLIKEIINSIKEGKIVVFPTDTVYGLICDATNKKAVNKIFKIKKRNNKKPLPLFVKSITGARKIAKINKKQESFLKKMWPGKITVILEKKPKKIYGVDKKTIALRIPNYKPLNLLLDQINIPLSQTSANISKENPAKTAKEVFRNFNNQKHKPDLIIDGGFLKNRPSKIIDLTVIPPNILR